MAKVLIVDDSAVVAHVLQTALGANEYEFRFATSAEEALTQVETDCPDIILLDKTLPGMGGIEFLSSLKADRRLQRIPVILVTADEREESLVEALEAGATDYLCKPFTQAVVRARVRNVLHAYISQRKEIAFGKIVEDCFNEIYIFHAETNLFLHVNRGARLNLGYRMDELKEMTPLDLKPEYTAEGFARLVEPLRTGRTAKIEFETVHRRKDGSLYPVEVHLQCSSFDDMPVYVAVILDISDRRQAEKRMAHMSAIVECSDDAIIGESMDGTITFWNEGAAHLYGFSEREAIGRPVSMLSPSGLLREDALLKERARCGERTEHFDSVRRHKNGSLIDVSMNVSPIRDANGEIFGISIIARDISHQKQQAAALQAAQKEAEQASATKSEFLANMSHEIRTPMTAILGFSEILSDSNLTPEQADAVGTISRHGEHLLGLINDILDLSKVESGRLRIERVPCSPAEIIADVVSLMKVKADAKGLSLTAETASPLPETIDSDPTRLKQILLNLVGNAVKFTEAGSVRIVARLNDRQHAKQLQFDVIDTGIGMTEEQMGKVFQPFTQADTSTTRKYGGTGLGLSISKRLTEMLNGHISLDSQPSHGTTFTVTLNVGSLKGVPMSDRLDRDDSRAETSSAKYRDAGPLDCRVLLAEDGPDNQRLISMLLKKAGAQVSLADNGQTAFESAIAAEADGNPFDVILMDMQMPVLDGFEATKRLRQSGYSGPIIALTAHAMGEARQNCLDAGCDDYASKPINRKALLSLIHKYSNQVATELTGV